MGKDRRVKEIFLSISPNVSNESVGMDVDASRMARDLADFFNSKGSAVDLLECGDRLITLDLTIGGTHWPLESDVKEAVTDAGVNFRKTFSEIKYDCIERVIV